MRNGSRTIRQKAWMQAQFDEKKVEPNSGLGKAFTYMLKHGEPLTLFLRVSGAPLDNNIVEQSLKMVIRHRRNSLFYRTLHGAYIGDLFMSLIHTCRLSKVNPFITSWPFKGTPMRCSRIPMRGCRGTTRLRRQGYRRKVRSATNSYTRFVI